MAEPYICPHCHTKWLSMPDACQCGLVNKPAPPVNGALATLFPAEPPPPLEPRAAPRPPWHGVIAPPQEERPTLAQQLAASHAEQAALIQAFTQMVQPLLLWWQQQGQAVPIQDLIPRTVEALTALVQQVQAPPQTVTPTVPPETGTLVQALDALRQSIEVLHAKFSPPPEPYPTWLQTDQRIAQMERGIRESNTMRQEGFTG